MSINLSNENLSNKALLSLLQNDVRKFNQYRDDNPEQSIYFFRADLQGANLLGANLLGANLIRADFWGANLQGAYLWDAKLQGAGFWGAILRDASLQYADLEGANLTDADLMRANLTNAKLQDANLADANLIRANLADAGLMRADLTGANLEGADLTDADLTDAGLDGAWFSLAKLKGAKLPYDAPVVPNIHKKLAPVVNKDSFDMGEWHCETTHCRAGWVVTLAGKPGRDLEEKIGTDAAAALIYMASDPELEQIPNWYADNDDALADIQAMAEASK